MNNANNLILKDYINKIEDYLNSYFKNFTDLQKNVTDAMTYSLMAGGKRIRPVLILEFYKMCGGKNNILPIASSIEMIHTFSLIHDDMPCMDNDDYRRGKLSCHKKYGESIALLAGDALNTLPFEIISSEAINGNISAEDAVKVIQEISKSVGVNGMIGGQVIDIEHDGKPINIDILKKLDSLKTGALIKSACKIGCILAGADDDKINSADKHAENIGVDFQIIDDILDVTSTFEKLGKPINSDENQNKSTFVSLYGLEKSKSIAEELTENALKELDNFKNNSFMKDLTEMLLIRDY